MQFKLLRKSGGRGAGASGQPEKQSVKCAPSLKGEPEAWQSGLMQNMLPSGLN